MEHKLRVGRNVKLNRKVLQAHNNKVSIVPFGDLHAGHPNCLWEKAKAMLDYCIKKRFYIIGMGDLLECGITGSVGDSVYTQKLNPQEQMEAVIELLQPVAEAGLLLGLHSGN